MQRNTKYEKMILQNIRRVPPKKQLLLLQLVKLYAVQPNAKQINTGLEKTIAKIQSLNIFKKIKNPVAWQRKLRNEW